MKTDEQVNKAAYRASLSQYGSVHHEDYESTANGFIMGYNQAKNDLESRWKDINFELPEEGGRYWCYVKELNDGGWWSHYQWNCSYNESTKEWGDTDGNKVTHWTELLPAPKD